VENRRVSGGRTVQRHVLYLGEINDAQRAAWCRTIDAFDEDGVTGRFVQNCTLSQASAVLGDDT
jgi:hypothetical protein